MKDVLFLAHRAPFAPDRGDRIRSYHVLRHLCARARVHLVCFADAPEPLPDLPLASCTVVPRRKHRGVALLQSLASGRPVSLTAFADPRFAAAVARVRRDHPIAATYIFSGQMAQYAAAGEHTVMDFVDVDSAKFAELATRGPAPMRRVLAREARLLGEYERRIAEQVEAALFVSDAEATLFRTAGGGGHVVVSENGIDAAFFDPAGVVPVSGSDAPLIVFTGQMDYAPNIEAVGRFVAEVLPAIRRRHPQASFAIVGRAPTPAVRALAGAHITVTGEVADVRGWLAAASVCVAPLRLARGVQNKVLEAMAMARPVVATPAAATGIDHGGTIAIADGDNMAAAVADLIDDPGAASRLGAAARAQILYRYAWDARLAGLDALLGLDGESVRKAA